MQCPHCKTINRDDRETCYHCGRDLVLLRLMMNRAKKHFNTALKHVEEGNYYEAVGELNSAIELNAEMIEAHVMKGSILSRLERSEEARAALEAALRLRPNAMRAHKYLLQMEGVKEATPLLKRVRTVVVASGAVAVLGLMVGGGALLLPGPAPAPPLVIQPGPAVAVERGADSAREALRRGDLVAAYAAVEGERGGAAEGLRLAIEAAAAARLEAATMLMGGRQYEQALSSLDGLERLPTVTAEVARLRRLAAVGLLEDLRDAMEQEVAGPQHHRRVEELQRRYLELNPGGEPTVAALTQARAQRWRDELAERAAAITVGAAPGEVLRAQLQDLERFAGDRDLMGEETLHRVREIVGRVEAAELMARARRAVEGQERHEFENSLELLGAYRDVLPTLADDMAALRVAYRDVAVASIESALGDGARLKAIRMAADLEATGEVLAPELARRVQHAREAVALASYYELMDTADEIEAGRLDRPAAEAVLAHVALARGPLPPRVEDRAREALHFFAAAAHRTLGHGEQATAEINALQMHYPESPWLLIWNQWAPQTAG